MKVTRKSAAKARAEKIKHVMCNRTWEDYGWVRFIERQLVLHAEAEHDRHAKNNVCMRKVRAK